MARAKGRKAPVSGQCFAVRVSLQGRQAAHGPFSLVCLRGRSIRSLNVLTSSCTAIGPRLLCPGHCRQACFLFCGFRGDALDWLGAVSPEACCEFAVSAKLPLRYLFVKNLPQGPS